jgi:hypothetical protein
MDTSQEAGKRGGVTVKTLKRVLKKAGLKTTGKKTTLTRRAKKARLMGGGIMDSIKEAAASKAKEVAQSAINKAGDMASAKLGTIPPPATGGRHRGRKH